MENDKKIDMVLERMGSLKVDMGDMVMKLGMIDGVDESKVYQLSEALELLKDIDEELYMKRSF